jgi:3',5'-cyclic AMP phosphodiesterase CpdA
MHKIAIVADPHYHEVFPGYRFEGVKFDGREGAAIRTRGDSAASTRIFNESYFALPAVLDACVAEGIRTIVIAGDLTDDGQIATMDGALALLRRYSETHGVRFFLTPGNHDVFAMSGRHHAKAFYTSDGGSAVVTSDPELAAHEGAVLDPMMFCRSYHELAPLWAPYGLQRQAGDLHWECPFGKDDAFEARMFEVTSPDGSVVHRQLDLSYLVEPEPGLWLAAVDANVFEPRNGRADSSRADAVTDSTDAGWNAVVRLKPFILDWLSDVAARADAQGKTLICFSHYPAIDTYDGTIEDESVLLGGTQATRRTPLAQTSAAVARTGIGTHFSGHLHVADTSSVVEDGRRLTNVALPSPVAFPPGFAVVTGTAGRLNVDLRMIDLARFDAFFPFYRRDAEASGHPARWIEAASYPTFLYGHVRELVLHRYLPKEWPGDLALVFKTASVADLLALALESEPLDATGFNPGAKTGGPSGVDLVVDWYAARKGSELALEFIDSDRLALYLKLIEEYRDRSWADPGCLQSRVKLFLDMMARYLGTDTAVGEAVFAARVGR